MDHCKPEGEGDGGSGVVEESSHTSREANKMMWYGQWEAGGESGKGAKADYGLPEGCAIHGP